MSGRDQAETRCASCRQTEEEACSALLLWCAQPYCPDCVEADQNALAGRGEPYTANPPLWTEDAYTGPERRSEERARGSGTWADAMREACLQVIDALPQLGKGEQGAAVVLSRIVEQWTVDGGDVRMEVDSIVRDYAASLRGALFGAASGQPVDGGEPLPDLFKGGAR